jgi:hypothetical protein
MLRHVALNEERAGIGIEAAGDEERSEVERRLAQASGSCGTVIACRSTMG